MINKWRTDHTRSEIQFAPDSARSSRAHAQLQQERVSSPASSYASDGGVVHNMSINLMDILTPQELPVQPQVELSPPGSPDIEPMDPIEPIAPIEQPVMNQMRLQPALPLPKGAYNYKHERQDTDQKKEDKDIFQVAVKRCMVHQI